MLKKIGLPIVALLAIGAFAAPTQAKAGVHFGVAVGPAYPYRAYPYGYVSPYPEYGYVEPYGGYVYGGGYRYRGYDRYRDNDYRRREYRRDWDRGYERGHDRDRDRDRHYDRGRDGYNGYRR